MNKMIFLFLCKEKSFSQERFCTELAFEIKSFQLEPGNSLLTVFDLNLYFDCC